MPKMFIVVACLLLTTLNAHGLEEHGLKQLIQWKKDILQNEKNREKIFANPKVVEQWNTEEQIFETRTIRTAEHRAALRVLTAEKKTLNAEWEKMYRNELEVINSVEAAFENKVFIMMTDAGQIFVLSRQMQKLKQRTELISIEYALRMSGKYDQVRTTMQKVERIRMIPENVKRVKSMGLDREVLDELSKFFPENVGHLEMVEINRAILDQLAGIRTRIEESFKELFEELFKTTSEGMEIEEMGERFLLYLRYRATVDELKDLM